LTYGRGEPDVVTGYTSAHGSVGGYTQSRKSEDFEIYRNFIITTEMSIVHKK
jgi:hypothetical protein